MLQVVRAFDRSPIAEVETDDAGALETKLAAAAVAFRDRDGWLEPHERIDVLRRLSGLINVKREHFSRLIAQEGGKPLSDARVEVTRAIDGVRDAAGELRNFGGKEIPMGLTAASAGRLAFTFREPIGVVTAISAFNHPLNLIVHQVVPAIATGCPVLVKPASATPLCCFGFVDLVREAGLPEPWCQTFLPESNERAEAMATDPRTAFLSFIGSARVGWYLHGKLAHGTRSALEHGGVAPVIVDATADLDRVVPALAKGGYYHAGQVCVSVQRIFVHSSVKDRFLARFTEAVAALKVGDPLLPETEVGPLILPKEADHGDVLDRGGQGGGRGGRDRRHTSLRDNGCADRPGRTASGRVRLEKEEVFGPVTCVYGFSHRPGRGDRACQQSAGRVPVRDLHGRSRGGAAGSQAAGRVGGDG